MNERSSRSHSVFSLRVKGDNPLTGESCEVSLSSRHLPRPDQADLRATGSLELGRLGWFRAIGQGGYGRTQRPNEGDDQHQQVVVELAKRHSKALGKEHQRQGARRLPGQHFDQPAHVLVVG